MLHAIPVVVGLALVSSAAAAPPTENLIAGQPAGPWRRLFLDAMVVEQQQGLERVFHAARKFEGNPVVRAEYPWEKYPSYGGPYLYGTVLRDEGKLRMWYHVHIGGYGNAYAESTDGVHWTKPMLGLRSYGKIKDTNLYLTQCQDPNENPPFRQSGQCHNASIIKRPWEKDPAKRYVLFCYGVDYRHARCAYSPDGLRWTFDPATAEKGLFRSADVLNFFYDPYKSRYVATWKTATRRGRAAGVVWSNDGLKWTKPVATAVFAADDLDPDATQVYGMPVFPYQGLYIGQAWIYNARWMKTTGYSDQGMYEAERDSPCTMDVQLAWSWDLINWTRPPQREPFIPRGKKGEFDSGMIYTAIAPVQMGDELWFYYGGWDGPHNGRNSKANIGLAKLRLDGFCSMRAGDTEGWFVSRRERFRVPKVTINARVRPGGYVAAEIVDTANKPIPGFTRKDCVPFTGDSVRHVLTWKTTALPEDQIGGDKKFRFYLKNADLYSYLPDPTTGPIKIIYAPAENGGLLASDRKLPESQRFRASGVKSGYRIAKEGGMVYADLHSVGAYKTNASFFKDADFDDDTDWCMEMWCRIVDAGDEPNYGLSSFVRPNNGRGCALYLSDKAVGILSSKGYDHRTLESIAMDTTDRFHWYRLVHERGADGDVAVWVDGKEVIRMPFEKLYVRHGRGVNLSFGPNAGTRTGRMHVAKYGFKTGDTTPIFGPIKDER